MKQQCRGLQNLEVPKALHLLLTPVANFGVSRTILWRDNSLKRLIELIGNSGERMQIKTGHGRDAKSRVCKTSMPRASHCLLLLSSCEADLSLQPLKGYADSIRLRATTINHIVRLMWPQVPSNRHTYQAGQSEGLRSPPRAKSKAKTSCLFVKLDSTTRL